MNERPGILADGMEHVSNMLSANDQTSLKRSFLSLIHHVIEEVKLTIFEGYPQDRVALS